MKFLKKCMLQGSYLSKWFVLVARNWWLHLRTPFKNAKNMILLLKKSKAFSKSSFLKVLWRNNSPEKEAQWHLWDRRWMCLNRVLIYHHRKNWSKSIYIRLVRRRWRNLVIPRVVTISSTTFLLRKTLSKVVKPLQKKSPKRPPTLKELSRNPQFNNSCFLKL